MFINLINRITFSLQRVKPNRKFQVPFQNWSLVKGDTVMVRAGSDKGQIGEIIHVFRRQNAVVVKGLNLKTKRNSNYHTYYRKLRR
jgi:hypothetical protein